MSRCYRWGVSALSCIGVIAGTARAQQLRPAPPLVLDGVIVVDVEHGTLRAAQRVVIVGNRLRAVGKRAAVAIPSGARVVDGGGKYLVPGFWDLHMHTFVPIDRLAPGYQFLLANGITGFRDPGTTLPLDTLLRLRQETLAGTRIGPPRQLFTGYGIDSPVDCGQRRVTLGGHYCVTDSADARHLVDSLRAIGVDMLKMYDLSAEMYFVLAAEARKLGMPFGGHSTNVSPFDAADSGASIFDHYDTPGISALFDSLCFRPSKATVEGCRPVAERWRRTNTWSVPTLVHTAYGGTDTLRRTIPLLLLQAVERFFAGGPYDPAWLRHSVPLDPQKSRRFPWLHVAREVGLPIALGTDRTPAGNAGFALHAEMAIMVERGLTPLAALQAATLNPAKLLRATDSLGTVAPGKLADLVLLDANPLIDITNTTAIRAVVANGRYFDRAALDGMLATAQAAFKENP